jgi:hypothetical protein
MTDSDLNFIQPVETLHNVPSLTPAQRQEERKRRQKPPQEQKQEPDEKPQNEIPQEPAPDQNEDRHLIDYRA